MFAHYVALKLKPNTTSEFTRLFDNRIIPMLRERKGFRDEITLAAPERATAIVISIWDTKENAETYNRAKFKEVLQTLSPLIEGVPEVETLQVTGSTLQKMSARGV
jgi:heme-degrading monooxygenase HmoA